MSLVSFIPLENIRKPLGKLYYSAYNCKPTWFVKFPSSPLLFCMLYKVLLQLGIETAMSAFWDFLINRIFVRLKTLGG